MSAAVMELNKVVDSMSESQIDKILSYAKFIKTDLRLNESIKHKRRIGIADGLYNIPDDIDTCNDEIAEMFGVN